MKQYNNILFDLDGTLIKSNFISQSNYIMHSYKKMIKNIELDFNINLFLKWLNNNNYDLECYFNDKQMNNINDFEFNKARIINITNTFNTTFLEAIKLDEIFINSIKNIITLNDNYCSQTLQYLNRKYNIFILTNDSTFSTLLKTSATDILQYINNIFSGDMVDEIKPNQIYFEEFKKRFDIDKNKTLLIGDSIDCDIKGGNIAGFDTCLLNEESCIENINEKPTYLIRKLSNLKEIL